MPQREAAEPCLKRSKTNIFKHLNALLSEASNLKKRPLSNTLVCYQPAHFYSPGCSSYWTISFPRSMFIPHAKVNSPVSDRFIVPESAKF